MSGFDSGEVLSDDEAVAAADPSPSACAPSEPPMTVASSYSPSTKAMPPEVTTPSAATDHSPVLAPLIAACTDLPMRGPAAV